MKSLFSTAGLARTSARHPWRVLAMWLVILVLAGVAASGLGDVLTTDTSFTNRPDSVRVQDLIETDFAAADAVTETVIVQSEAFTFDDTPFQDALARTATGLRAMDGVVDRVITYTETGAPEMVSADRHATVLLVTLSGDLDAAEEHVEAYLETIASLRTDQFQVLSVGDLSSSHESNEVSERDLQRAEVFGLPIALVILVVVFGALIAAGIPVLLGLISIFVALGLTALAGQVFDLSFYVVNMISMIGLAVGIDYALFIISRYREERASGNAKLDAIEIAGATASKAVLFSGATVVSALMGMFLLPTTVFRSLGMGAVLVVIVAVAAMLTLVPALLSLIGDRIDWPRRRSTRVTSAQKPDETGGFWGAVTRTVMSHAGLSVVLAVGVLVAAALPYLDMKTGNAGVESLPESDVKAAYRVLSTDFSAGTLSPIQFVIQGDAQLEAAAFVTELEESGQFGPVTAETNTTGTVTLVQAPLLTGSNSPEAYAAVETLRDDTIPAHFGANADLVLVGGLTAFSVDFNDMLDTWTPRVFIFVLGLSLLLLLIAFRSIVVPVKAIIMNLLSVGAAYGLLVLVFQKGIGAGLLGFTQTPTIESWVPIFLFCVLFGLSMDYHVFLLSRVREHYDATGKNGESVAVGLQSTARLITGAALIMVVVFGGFASGDLVMFQQMGFGLAIAVLIDATIVRSVLVPASMALLGDRNWYLPRWLGWLPNLQIEGGRPTPVIAPGMAD